jgi:uncharacterized protein YdaU (DUF1376 family)
MNPPKMPIHIGDYKRDTGHLRAAGHGAYLLLLFHHWSTGSLPDDDAQLASIACMTRPEWARVRPIIEKFFKPGWIHGRVIDDLAGAKASYDKRAMAGEKGGKAKALLKANPSNATAMPEQPLTLDQEKKEEAAGAASTYAFESGVIRLNQRDFEQWKEAFQHLDVPAELLAATQWASEQRSWFNALKGLLAKKNRDVKAEKDRLKEQGGFKWNSGIEGVI